MFLLTVDVNSLPAELFFFRKYDKLFAKFSEGTKTYIYFYVISPHWYDTGSWIPSSGKARTYLYYIVNIMAADVLATQGARASTTMILTMLNRINLVPTR